VFCRNVAIYFTDADKRKLFQKLGQVLARDGYLIIGGSESLGGIAPQFQAQNYLRGVYYQLQGAKEVAKKARQAAAARPAARKAVVKTPPIGRKKSPPQRSAEAAVRRPQKPKTNGLISTVSPSTKAREAATSKAPVAEESVVVSNLETPEIVETVAADGLYPAAGFLETAGSNEQSGESLLGNLPAARQVGEPLAIGGDAANGEEEKTSLLQKIVDRHQFGDDVPDRE
ncbi:MAG: hypothetical protein KAW01_01605, partial [Deltaproteobacteria bacterium]|nr:hypothetical protein [Deltaproteobacteria bacterium]